jgi:hypothetical protein
MRVVAITTVAGVPLLDRPSECLGGRSPDDASGLLSGSGCRCPDALAVPVQALAVKRVDIRVVAQP